MKRVLGLTLVFGILFSLFSTIQQAHNQTYTPEGHFWTLDSLRGLDNIDVEQSPDIIAYYARQTPDALQLRIDFLDISHFEPDLLFIEVFDNPSYLLSLGSTLKNQEIFWFINKQQNYISIQLPLSFKRFEFRLILKNQQNEITDFTSRFSLYSKIPPPIRIRLMINNTQLGYTPAQILRNWDGAHNGPFGERFGLSHLLTASENYQIPITLTDFLTPANVDAVNVLNQKDTIHQKAASGLLTLCSPNFVQDEVYSAYNNYIAETFVNQGYPPVPYCQSMPSFGNIVSPLF